MPPSINRRVLTERLSTVGADCPLLCECVRAVRRPLSGIPRRSSCQPEEGQGDGSSAGEKKSLDFFFFLDFPPVLLFLPPFLLLLRSVMCSTVAATFLTLTQDAARCIIAPGFCCQECSPTRRTLTSLGLTRKKKKGKKDTAQMTHARQLGPEKNTHSHTHTHTHKRAGPPQGVAKGTGRSKLQQHSKHCKHTSFLCPSLPFPAA